MNQDIKTQERETYISPDIEVVEIQIDQNILAKGSGKTLDMKNNDWNEW